MLRSSHDACRCSTQTTSTINLKRSTLHRHEGQADRPNTPSDSVNPGSNPRCPATQFGLLADFSWSVKIVDIPGGLGWLPPVSGRQFLAFPSFGRGFRAPVSARHFPISISAERRRVRLLTETGSRNVFRATPPGVYSLDRLFCPGVT